MRLFIKHISFLSLVAIFMLATPFQHDAQAQKRKKKKKDKEKTETISKDTERTDDVRKVEGVFIDANKFKLIGDLEKAQEKFEEVISMDPDNDAALYELAKIYYQNMDADRSYSLAKRAFSIDMNNKWYGVLYAEVAHHLGKYEEASGIYKTLTELNPNNYDFYYDYAFMLTKNEQMKDALKVYDNLEGKMGVSESISSQKRKIYLQMGETDKAAAEIEKLIKSDPKEARYYTQLAEVYKAGGKADKVKGVYERLLEIDPDNPYAQMAMATLSMKDGDMEQNFEFMKKAFSSDDMGIDAKVRMLFTYIDMVGVDEGRTKEAKALAQVLEDSHPTEAKALAIHGDILYRNKEDAAALDKYRKCVKLEPNSFTVWQQILIIHSDNDENEALKVASNEVIELFPNQSLPYYFNGIAENRLSNPERAVKVLKQAVMIGTENKSLLSQMYSQMGDAYRAQKDNEKSDGAFEKAIEADPYNAYVLNNYSYYLSLRGENLERAKELSLESNKLIPNNSSFQDTFAWILYKMKDYDGAKEWLEKAIKNGGDKSSTILDHLGDTYIRLKDETNAVKYWKMAIENGGDAAQINKKISTKKPNE